MPHGNSRKRSKKRMTRKQSKKHSSRKHYRKTHLSPFNVCGGLKKSDCVSNDTCSYRKSRGCFRKAGTAPKPLFNTCISLKKSVCNDQPMCNWRGSRGCTRKSGISKEKSYGGPFKPSWMFY